MTLGAGVTVLGCFLGQVPFVAANIELILVGIVLLSVLPIIIEVFPRPGVAAPPTIERICAGGSTTAGRLRPTRSGIQITWSR
jgi:hypothetical protein